MLEAAAAALPIIATRVGGIPEIFGPYRDRLVPCDDPATLHDSMVETLAMEPARLQRRARDLATHVQANFSVERMVDGVISGYRDAIATKAAVLAGGQPRSVLPSQRFGF